MEEPKNRNKEYPFLLRQCKVRLQWENENLSKFKKASLSEDIRTREWGKSNLDSCEYRISEIHKLLQELNLDLNPNHE